jgi:hypothetical protein
MALWGKQDGATPTGTSIGVTQGSTAVTGSSTTFLTDIDNGDVLIISGVKYRVASVTSNTALVLADNYAGSTNASLSISGAVYVQQQPKYAYQNSNHPEQGGAALSMVFGTDTTEIKVGGDNVVAVELGTSAGTQYMEVPAVSFSGGGGSSAAATAAISGGAVTGFTVSNTGSSYTSAPSVTVGAPFVTIATSAVNTGTDVITYNSHRFVTGDAVTYSNGGGTTMAGLTNNTVYYVNVASANTIKLYNTSANAIAGGATGLMDLTGTGNNAQTLTLTSGAATASAVLGSGTQSKIANPGWVLRRELTGGKAGRVQYEVLVAGRSLISGDAPDDIQLPDA